jgi:putative endonuclease
MNSGKIGEDAAASFLKKSGYTIIERNFRIRNGEIDIIALDPSTSSPPRPADANAMAGRQGYEGQAGEKTLVFVEVKTRSSTRFGTPFEAIHYWKLKALTNAAQVYKLSHPRLPPLLRIDAVAVLLDTNGGVIEIEHLKNISS